MDRQLLHALDNLSFALEAIADALERAKKSKETQSNVGTALSSTDINKKLDLIDDGVKRILKDNSKIIQNQETLIKMAKKKDKGQIFEDAGDKKQGNSIADGVKTVLVIAAGVLAIGLAFKIIGSVNFVSVIALAIALPLIAFAFEKISKIKLEKGPKGLLMVSFAISASIALISQILRFVAPVSASQLFTSILIAGVLAALSFSLEKITDGLDKINIRSLRNLWMAPLVFVTMAISIAASSYILNAVQPVGLFQMITAILIAGMFAAISYSFDKIMKGISELDIFAIAALPFLPVIFVAIATGIAFSSYILALTRPVGIFQLFTAIMIAAMFAVVSYGLNKIITAFKEIESEAEADEIAVIMPILLIAVTLAIVGASYLLQLTAPVSLGQMFTALLISVLFIPLAYSLTLVAKAIEKLDKNKIIALPAMILVMVALVTASSYILSAAISIPADRLWEIFLLSLTVVIISAAFSLLFTYVTSKVTMREVLMGAGVVLIVAGVITAASRILSYGIYEKGKYPDMWWAIGVGLSLVLFGAATVFLGVIAISGMGLGAVALIAGAAAVAGIAGLIVGVSHILPKGDYKGNYPDYEWTKNVAIAIVAFGAMTIALGALFLTGVGAAAYYLGYQGLPSVAEMIVKISEKLKDGKYTVPGFVEWSKATAQLYDSFVPIIFKLGAMGVGSAAIKFFSLGRVNPFEMAKTMLGEIADTMVLVSNKLAVGKFVGGPTETWARGISIALGAFAPIFDIVQKSQATWFSSGAPSAKQYADAITTIADGIKTASEKFSTFTEKSAPSEAWAKGVGGAFAAFAPVFDIVQKSKDGWFTKGIKPQQYKEAFKTIAEGIVAAAEYLGLNKASFDPNKAPDENWSKKVSGALGAFMPAIEFIGKNTGIFTSGKDMLVSGITTTSHAIVRSAEILGGGDYTKVVPETWSKNVDSVIRWYVNLATGFINPKKDEIFAAISSLRWVTYYIEMDARRFSRITTNSKDFNTTWMESIDKNVRIYVALAKFLGSKEGKTGASSFFGTPVTGVIYDLSKLADAYSTLARSVAKLNLELEKMDADKLSALKNLTGSIVLLSLMDTEQFNKMMSALEEKASIFVDAMSQIEDSSKNVPGKAAMTTNVKTGTTKEEAPKATLDDLYTVLQSVDGKLSLIQESATTISDYVEEVRSSNVKLREKKKE